MDTQAFNLGYIDTLLKHAASPEELKAFMRNKWGGGTSAASKPLPRASVYGGTGLNQSRTRLSDDTQARLRAIEQKHQYKAPPTLLNMGGKVVRYAPGESGMGPVSTEEAYASANKAMAGPEGLSIEDVQRTQRGMQQARDFARGLERGDLKTPPAAAKTAPRTYASVMQENRKRFGIQGTPVKHDMPSRPAIPTQFEGTSMLRPPMETGRSNAMRKGILPPISTGPSATSPPDPRMGAYPASGLGAGRKAPKQKAPGTQKATGGDPVAGLFNLQQ